MGGTHRLTAGVSLTQLTCIFDLDGTLVDSAADVRDLINPLLAGIGRRGLTRQEVIACFGLGAAKFLHRALALTGGPAQQVEAEQLEEQFVARYAVAPPVHSHAYPGAAAMLAICRGAGWRLGICTNKPQAAAATLLDHLDLSRWFDAVTGGDALEVRKPDPRHLLEAIRRCGGDPAQAVMIGDSETDAQVAIAAGIPLILVEGGYNHVPLEELGATRIVASLADVPAAVAELTHAREYNASMRRS